jgi:hypothetical protein
MFEVAEKQEGNERFPEKGASPDGAPFEFLMASNEVVLFTRVQEEDLRVFFRCFLIGHLATNPDMDGYLGFTPPESLALSNGYL